MLPRSRAAHSLGESHQGLGPAGAAGQAGALDRAGDRGHRSGQAGRLSRENLRDAAQTVGRGRENALRVSGPKKFEHK